MKSAYERALERLNAEGSDVRSLSEEEKQQAAEIENQYASKIAEVTVTFDQKIAVADMAAAEEMRAEKAREIQRLEEKRDAEKEALWAEGDR